jgi:hypothetical protein
MVMDPAMPVRSPVPEPGTTVTAEFALLHGADVLEGEGAGVSLEGTGNVFDGDVAGCAFGAVAGAEHLAFACGFDVAVELFVESEAADGRAGGGVVGWERGVLYVKGSFCVAGHDGILPQEFRVRGLRMELNG